jgi:hypothetical protein
MKGAVHDAECMEIGEWLAEHLSMLRYVGIYPGELPPRAHETYLGRCLAWVKGTWQHGYETDDLKLCEDC